MQRSDDSVAGATRHSSEDSRQVLPLNHPARRGFRVFAAVVAVVGVVLAVLTVGAGRPVGIVFIAVAVLVVLASVAPGNLAAFLHVLLGALIILTGLFMLGVATSSLNDGLHASVLNICGYLLVGLVTGGCGLYEWETDDHGRMSRRIRSAVARDTRDTDVRRDPLLAERRR